MERNYPLNDLSQYAQQHFEPQVDRIELLNQHPFTTPWQKESVTQVETGAEAHFETGHLAFDCSLVPLPDFATLPQSLTDTFTNNPEYWREVRSFSLSNTQKEQAVLSTNIVPPDTRIFVTTLSPPRPDQAAIFRFRDNAILLYLEEFSPANVLSLLHEIGHAQDFTGKNMDQNGYDQMSVAYGSMHMENSVTSPELIDIVLRTERNANAVLLKAVRPLIEDDSPDAVLTKANLRSYIHGFGLGHYTDVMRRKVDAELITDLETVLANLDPPAAPQPEVSEPSL